MQRLAPGWSECSRTGHRSDYHGKLWRPSSEQPNVRLLAPGDQHWPVLKQMLMEGQARGPLVSDAELAALTIEYGGTLQTTDRDFARFPGLRLNNPLE